MNPAPRLPAFLFFLLFCSLAIPFCAQGSPAALHYTIDEGLPSNEVYDIYEDHSGYTWFATDHGISRFDGYSFHNYSTSDGLTHNTVFGFHEDSRGRLWMRAFNSTLCYLENGLIHPYAHNAELQQFLGREFIQCFAFDKAENLFFVSIRKNMGLFRLDATSGKIERVDLPDGFNAFIRELDSGEFIGGMDLDNGCAATATVDDTICFRDHTWLFRMPQLDVPAGRQLVRCQKRGNDAYIFSHDGQLALLGNGRITAREKFPELITQCYAENGNCWLCMNGFTRFVPGEISPRLLNTTTGTAMLRDRMGNFWFTTISDGVYLVRNMQLGTLDQFHGEKISNLLDLEVSENRIIALNQNGVIFRFRMGETGVDTTASDTWPEKFPGKNLLYANAEKNFIVLPDKIYSTENADGEWKLLMSYPSPGGVRGYAMTGDSLLIAGNQQWVIVRDGKLLSESRLHGFVSFCTAIAADKNKKIWIGTTDGLFYADGTKTIPYAPGNPLFRQRVTDIAFGKNGEMIISTRGGGVIVVDGKKIYSIRTSDGLSSEQCGTICVDDSVLWVCSNNGLNRIVLRRKNDSLSFTCGRIGTEHGLPSLMVNDAVRAGNFLFLATGKGLAWFDVREFRFNTIPPPVYISSFLTNNRPADPSANSLTWRDNNVSIGFISLLYRSPGKVNYRYRLEGYESSWNYTNERMARYFNLPPGQYTFAVSAMNENGVWNDHATTVQFYIPAHFTQTAWFRLLVILLVAGAASGLVFIFVKQRHDRTKAAMALSIAEQKALRSQMKPHFIFNSLNSIQNFIVNRDEDSAQVYLSSFAQLMRRVLEQSGAGTITLEEEIETLGIYLELEKLRFGETFAYTITLQPGLNASTLLIPPLLIQPYVENAIWHGLQLQKNSPRLELRFTIEKERLVVEVEDNGIGRKRAMAIRPQQRRTSTGMKNVLERIALMNANTKEKISVTIVDLTGADGQPSGTRVVLNFPVIRKEEIPTHD